MDCKDTVDQLSVSNSSISVPVMHELVQSFKNEIESTVQRILNIPHDLNSFSNIPIGSRRPSRGGPRHVSIGPLHWNDPRLGKMEDHKRLLIHARPYYYSLLDNVESCFLRLKDFEERTRRAYPKIIEMTCDQFVVMLFLDAYFIIDRLVDLRLTVSTCVTTCIHRTTIEEYGISGMNVPTNCDIDLVMLDNQIPFFVIESVWKWLQEHFQQFEHRDLHYLLCEYLDVPHGSTRKRDYYHLLHFLYCGMIPQESQGSLLSGRKHWIPSATELKESGIKFRLTTSPCSILDIKFSDGTIQIPPIWITEPQRIKLENLVDFEQSNSMVTHFSNYFAFMSCLLCDEKDVRIISVSSIFENRLGSDKDVQQFFQKLHQRSSYWDDDTFLGDVCVKINNYQKSRRNRWKAIFRRNFCSNPWVTLSVTGAVILFILTFLQTFFTVYSYFHPPS